MSQSDTTTTDWRDVYRCLRRQIDHGVLAPGSRLPTIAALASDHGLTPHGARRVLESLRDDGKVTSWQGHSNRVAEPQLTYRVDRNPGFGRNTARLGHQASSRLIVARMTRATAEIAKAMSLRTGTRIYQSELLRMVDGRPVSLARNHFHTDRFEGILEDIAATGSVTKALALYGVTVWHRKYTRLAARLPTSHETLALDIPAQQPVIVTMGVNVDEDGVVVEVSKSPLRADRIALEI